MALYAIGDIQGCDDALERLLDEIAFDPAQDRLWVAGDLVNRGPGSVAVLRRLMGLGGRVDAVLGNHDLHLIGRALGVRRRGKRDTLDRLLDARDREAMIRLAPGPAAAAPGGRSGAGPRGAPPGWSLDEAEALAREAEGWLKGPDAGAVLAGGPGGDLWSPALEGVERARAVVNVLTRMRTLAPDGRSRPGLQRAPRPATPGARALVLRSPGPTQRRGHRGLRPLGRPGPPPGRRDPGPGHRVRVGRVPDRLPPRRRRRVPGPRGPVARPRPPGRAAQQRQRRVMGLSQAPGTLRRA